MNLGLAATPHVFSPEAANDAMRAQRGPILLNLLGPWRGTGDNLPAAPPLP